MLQQEKPDDYAVALRREPQARGLCSASQSLCRARLALCMLLSMLACYDQPILLLAEPTQPKPGKSWDGKHNKAAQLKYGQMEGLQRDREAKEIMLLEIQALGPTLLREQVTEADIAEIVAKWTGIPVNRLLESERQKLLQLESHLHERVVGQAEAVAAVAAAIRRARAGMKDLSRPIGSFLFMGPTGVGKTELARALAQFLFDADDALMRLDMSEYMEKRQSTN